MFGDQQVTVIILSYQNYMVLHRAVSSVLSQNYPNIQLIISDDHSNFFDKYTLEQWIEKEKRKNLKEFIILRNEKNVGTVQNLIRAMDVIKGDYYLTLGADDALYDDSVISAYISVFQEHPDAWWVAGYMQFMNRDFKRELSQSPMARDVSVFMRRNQRELLSRWSYKGLLGGPCVCFRSGVADLVGGYDEQYVFCEDWPLFFKLVRKGILPYFLPRKVVKHSIGGITSKAKTKEQISKRKIFLDDKYRLLKNEVDAYPGQLINVRDRQGYRHYMRIFMDRTYTMEIEFALCTSKQKLKMMLKRPMIFFWFLQERSVLISDFIIKNTANVNQWLFVLLLSIIAYAVLTPISTGIAFYFQMLMLCSAAFTLTGLLAHLLIGTWRRLGKLIKRKRGF